MDLITQLMNHTIVESTCKTSQQYDDEHDAQEVKQDATTDSAHQELLSSGLSWPTVVAAAVESSPIVVATNSSSPPQLHDSTDADANATVVPRSPACSEAADYFDMMQTPPPTPKKKTTPWPIIWQKATHDIP